MKKVRIEDAIGLPLLHDVTQITDSFKGAKFRRGHIITAGDVNVLLDMGKKYVYVSEEGDNLVHEEDAAKRLAGIAKCNGTHFSDVSEGKIVQYADADGLLVIDVGLLNELNGIDDVTICTQRNHSRIRKGDRVASMRIVPLWTDEKNITDAEKAANGKRLFTLCEYKHKKVGIVITGSEVYSGRIEDKFQPVLKRKLSQFPHEIVGIEICDDDEEMIRNACIGLMGKGADLLLLTGGMSVDADDVTPDAVKSLGFEIVTYGVPSQPGNMTLIAYKGAIPAIGIPSAAISRPTTVLDVILPSLFADVRVTKKDVISMANGGLCSLCDKDGGRCHFPNCHFGNY
ncbi:MAG TPA: molybdopterin-binding protein [Spirochaetaceae bacterium]|nr:molybdopterin-binding protein [Spirochaetaceae bacterium]